MESDKMHYVIIGNGVAGISAAHAIRDRDSHSPVTIV
jgi:glycine/D-amino acid oxidase-like deaminating enzyme